jgi:hypothetical protein
MTGDEYYWPYWSVDLPGIGRAQAEELLAMAVKAGMSFGGWTVDPSLFFTVHLDRSTAEGLYRALCAAEPGGDSARTDEQDSAAVRESLKEWLDQASD